MTADDYVRLSLNLERGRMWKAYVVATAMRIAAGEPASVEYLELFTKDRKAAGELRGDQLLTQMMSGVL